MLKLSHFYKNLPTDVYINILDKAKCIVGNSSSGIREGNFIGVPCVNIGSRQNYRERGKNVLDVKFNKNQIISAINLQISRGKYKSGSLYGDGSAGKK